MFLYETDEIYSTVRLDLAPDPCHTPVLTL